MSVRAGQAGGAQIDDEWYPPMANLSLRSQSTDHFDPRQSVHHNYGRYNHEQFGTSNYNHSSSHLNLFENQHYQIHPQNSHYSQYSQSHSDFPPLKSPPLKSPPASRLTHSISNYELNNNAYTPPVPQPPPHIHSSDHIARLNEGRTYSSSNPTNRGHHSRNSSWTAPRPHHIPSHLYAHQNNTVDNISTASQQHSQNIAVPERKARISQIYGMGSHRNLSSTTMSSSATGSIPSVPPLKYNNRNSSSTSLRSTSSSFGSMAPAPHLHALPAKNSGRMSESSSSSSINSKIHPPQQPSGNRTSVLSSVETGNFRPDLPPLDTRHSFHQGPESVPVSAATNASIRNLMTPPTPAIAQSAPPSPMASPGRGFSLPKLFSNRKSMSRAPSSMSRESSPSLATRIGSRLSSGLSSRFGSRLSSGANTPNNGRTSSLNPNREKHAGAVLQGLDDDWPEFTPRRPPQDPVLAELGSLGSIHGPLVDIDVQCRQPPLTASKLGVNEQTEPEVKGFSSRGLYYYQPGGGSTGENGNYQHEVGEHVGFRYEVKDILGKGSFGTVYKCRDHKSGRMVAVKITANRAELHGQAKIEAAMLRSLMTDHQGQPELHHFVRFVEHFKFKGHFCIATEMLGPNLYELLKRNNYKGFEELSVRYITRQLCEGLEFLAAHGIIHCDLKPENILVSDVEQCQVKIVDFGSGCYEGKRLYTYIQSRFYRAPEILLGMPYSFGIDMWSLGAIVAELLLGKPLFPSVDESDQVALMAQVLGPPDPLMMWRCTRAGVFFSAEGYPLELRNSKGVVREPPGATPVRALLSHTSESAIDFVENVLQWSPEARLKADKAVYHSFVLGH